MGNVVNLDAPRAGRRKPRRAAQRSVKTALVLGGGGFTGAVYEIGALRALDLLSVNRSVNHFDVYVGTSAGALIAALTANGVTPEQMMRVVNDQAPTPFRDINLGHAAAPELPRVRRQGRSGCRCTCSASRAASVAACGSFSTVDLAIALADALPSGLYSGSGLEEYVRSVLDRPGPHRRLPPARAASSTSRRPTSTRASASCSAPRAGTTCRSRSPCAPRPRCRWSTSRSWSRTAS